MTDWWCNSVEHEFTRNQLNKCLEDQIQSKGETVYLAYGLGAAVLVSLCVVVMFALTIMKYKPVVVNKQKQATVHESSN